MKTTPKLLKEVRKTIPLEIIIILVTLIACVSADSYFFIACSIYLSINVLIRAIMLLRFTDKKGKEVTWISEKKMYVRCLCGNFILSIASLGILGCGILMFFLESQMINISVAIIVVFLAGINLLFMLRYYMIIKNYTDILIKSYRIMNYAYALINFALLVSVTLSISDTENIEQLIGITGIVFGGGTLSLTGYILWYVLLTNEKNRNLYYHIRNNRMIIFTRLSLKKDVALVLGKVILSCITLSGFVFVNALYSAGMGIAKYGAIRAQEKEQKKQIQSYFEIGASILGASLCYVVYSLSMFSKEKPMQYNMNITLIIAVYTFTELFLIIKDYIKARKTKNLISEEIKLIGLSSTLICLVLTQVAIMSISHKGDATFFNGLSGIVFGSMSALIGIYMMLRSKFLKQKFYEIQDKNN
ncbi:hypothetical protein AC231_13900 [Clostridium pasteurianum]|nr:hypothetical protein [Clostridium pasteurianum]OMH21554.1 hypothetical protein AC231_13900 [Clostridium pasteurianum]